MVERSERMWSTGEVNGKPLQYSCLENPMNGPSLKTLKEMGIPDHLTCLLRNLYASQEATVRSLVREIRKIILFRLQR